MPQKVKILITGAAGFLGGRVAKHLASLSEFEIIATSRRNHRKQELSASGCQFVEGNLLDNEFCKRFTQEADIVIHCAALSAPFGKYQQFHDANVIATQNIVTAAAHNHVKRFINIGTPSIYFSHGDRFNVKESDPLPKKMVNPYAATKLIAENFVLSKNSDSFKTLSLRPRAIIGAEDTVIFPRVLAAHQAGRLKIIGNGSNICDLTSAINVVEAIKKAIEAKDEAFGEAYNITDGNAVNFWQALDHVFNAIGQKPPTKKIPRSIALRVAAIIEGYHFLLKPESEPALTKYGVGVLSNNFTLDISKAREKLGYKPLINSFQGLDEFVTWHNQLKTTHQTTVK